MFTAAIETAVKERAKKMERTFVAAVNDAVRRQMKKLEAANRKATEVKIAKNVKTAVLEARIKEVHTSQALFCETKILTPRVSDAVRD